MLTNLFIAVVFGVASPSISIALEPQPFDDPGKNEGKEIALCSRAHPCLEDSIESGGPMPSPRGGTDAWDVLHYLLDIELTLEYVEDALDKVKVAGSNTVTGRAVTDGLTEITLNLRSNMNLSGITGNIQSYVRDVDLILITLDRPYLVDEQFVLVITYDGYPDEGGYGAFSFWERNGNPVIATLSEPYYARNWWPCRDVLGDKATGETHITVPDTMIAVSNGVLDGTDVLTDARLKFRWRTDYPMAVYLTSMAVTNYEVYERIYSYSDDQGTQTMPVYCWLYPDHWNDATGLPLPGWKAGCDETLAILEDLSSLYGQYPFVLEKYGLAETGGAGGLPASMEHQTVSSMYQINSYSDIVAHETAHQWWGDNITCATWYDIWLNEGFASYSEALYREVKVSGGIDSYWDRMIERLPSDPDGQVYRTSINNVNSIFSGNDIYDKGAWVLHMLRHVVGDDVFFNGLANYRAAFQGGFAVTDDFEAVMSEAFGQDLSFFFDQWVMSPGSADYFWNFESREIDGSHYVVLWVDQQQDSGGFGLITMPIDIRITTANGVSTQTVWNDDWTEYYVLAIDGPLVEVEFDEEDGQSDRNWVLYDRRKLLVEDLLPPPVVVDFTARVFGAATPGTTELEFHFSETVSSFDASAIQLTGDESGAVDPIQVAYDSSLHRAVVTYANLPDDSYSFVVRSTQVTANGLELDGEVSAAAWWDTQWLPSGDGQPGGDAEFSFSRRRYDADQNGDVDLADYASFQDCVNGPGGSYDPGCDFFDGDADGDVDLADFSGLQQTLGSN